MGGHSGCQIQLFWGGDRGGNGGGVVTGLTGGYRWLWSGHRQWVPCKSEGERERRGKAGVLRSVLWALRQKSWTMKILWVPGHYFLGENERSEEEARRGERSELSREESVNLSLQVRPPHDPRQLVRAGRKTLFCGGQILWWGEWNSAAPVGLVLGLQGGEMEGLIRRESLGVGGDALQGLGATQSYSEVPEVKHNKNCTSKTTSSSSGPAQYALLATLGHFLFIYMFYIQIWQHMQHSITQSTACGSS